MKYKAIVFDYDGTIVDTERVVYACWRGVFRDHGIDLPLSDWIHAVGAASDAVDPYAMLCQRLGRPVDRSAVESRRRTLEKELLAKEPLRPGIAGLIQEAKHRGLKIAVASNSPYPWVARGLSSYGLVHLFDAVCTPDDGVPPKPDPALYLLAAERLGVTPVEAIAIEDSPHGAAAAMAAGLFCVVVPSELTRDREFPPGCAVKDSLEGMSVDELAALGSESRRS